jgi:hypothetical protein
MNRRRITLLLTQLAIETVLIACCTNKRIGRAADALDRYGKT